MNKVTFLSLLIFLTPVGRVLANEGMWQPQQLPEFSRQLKSLGLELNPENLSKLNEHPMAAVISLGGCTASFVSPSGLILTNHHCAVSSIQYNSTTEKNLLEQGFLAKTKTEELPAAPGSRVYVTAAVENVTQTIKNSVDDSLSGLARYEAISNKKKELVQACESDKEHRCEVYSFYGDLEYYLIKRLEIRDVRLVYAPSTNIGQFGGDIDNWMWPRHAGDFTFYRAYVDKNGRPADYSPDNIPYQPQDYLKISPTAIKPNEFVMAIGYPGRTNRYRLAAEVENTFTWYYPIVRESFLSWSKTIEQATQNNEEAKIKYATRLHGLQNSLKNFQGMIDGFARNDLLSSKRQLEEALQSWIDGSDQLRDRYQDNLKELKEAIARRQASQKKNLPVSFLDWSDLFSTARNLYRFSLERQKPDLEREPGYQDRDLTRFKESLIRLDRRFDSEVDKAVWLNSIEAYTKLSPEERIPQFDRFFNLEAQFDRQKVKSQLDAMYGKTGLTDLKTRLKWIDADPKTFEASEDPFIQLAIALFDSDIALENEEKELEASLEKLRPLYMEALIAYYQSQSKPIYPDANGTLRVTFGRVRGYSPADGIFYTPFTTLQGLNKKYSGQKPFDLPKKQLELMEKQVYGPYYNSDLNSVAVNFLSDLDSTGGNSGSPTLNSKGELVGLLFDTTYDTLTSDWKYNDDARTIHVDINYMLWVMKYVDNAVNLQAELGVKQ